MKICLRLLALAGFLVLAASGQAAIKKAEIKAPDDPSAYNPNADQKDLELPMPAGVKLVMRAVPIAAKSPLEDQRFQMGLRNVDENRAIYEKPMDAYIGAPFRQDNFPDAWQGKLPADEKDAYAYYMIGKYELTNGQWAAVMGEEPDGNPDLPKTGISWYDIQDFLRRYNEWLLKNHPDAVPAIDGVPAFVRIPTEAEWEYAARWGNPEENMIESDFPGLEPGKQVADYAVFGLGNDVKKTIGSRRPNKLGIYDMAGNVAELVQGGFRFPVVQNVNGVRISRPHGSEGGLVRKGGSHLDTQENEVYPGRREELRMFEKGPDGYVPQKKGDLGVRLVLASPNVPGAGREQLLQSDANKLAHAPAVDKAPEAQVKTAATASGQDGLVAIDILGDPERELEKIYQAAKSPLVKSNLMQYRELIRGQNEALSRERSANYLSLVRAGAYKADNLVNIAFRCFQVEFDMDNIRQLSGQKINPETEKKLRAQMLRHFRNLQVATNLYRQGVEEAANAPRDIIDEKVRQLRKEYGGDDQLSELFRANLDVFARQVAFARENGIQKLTNDMIWKNVLPKGPIYTTIATLARDGKK